MTDNKLTPVSDINLGVEILDNGKYKETVSAHEADFHECPKCGSDDISYGESECESVFIYRVHRCNTCDASWEERYDLVRVEIKKGEER